MEMTSVERDVGAIQLVSLYDYNPGTDDLKKYIKLSSSPPHEEGPNHHQQQQEQQQQQQQQLHQQHQPHVDRQQLHLQRGEVLDVVSEQLSWWMLCRSTRTGNEGYVSTVLCAPLHVSDGTVNETDDTSNDSGSYNMMYFPNAPIPPKKNTCPRQKANVFSCLSFWWLTDLMVTGFRRTYVDSDLWDLNENNKTDYLYEKFKKKWECEIEKWRDSERQPNGEGNNERNDCRSLYKPSVTRAFIKLHGFKYFLITCCKLLHSVTYLVHIFLLRELIHFIDDKGNADIKWGYIYTLLMVVNQLVQSVLAQNLFWRADLIAMKVKAVISASVYRKILLLDAYGRQKFTAGEIVNMASVDVFKIMEFLNWGCLVVAFPVEIIAGSVFLYHIFGSSMFAGLGVLLLTTTFNMKVSKYQKTLKSKEMLQKDKRIKILNEILNGIKVLKLYAWEESFMTTIRQYREKELKILLKSSIFRSLLTLFMSSFVPITVSLVTFGVYVVLGNELTAEKVFTGLALFDLLKIPVNVMPKVMFSLRNANVAVKRIAKILNEDELQNSQITKLDSSDSAENSIEIENGTYTWDNIEEPVLKDVNLKIRKGSLVAIVGRVGEGKSSLISALLGEIRKVTGSARTQGRIAYVAQLPWIQNKTVKENIQFNIPYNKQKYERVVQACALEADIETFPNGDNTQIGEKGINLSGGQKQRVSLARAVYNNADVYILDDPLSAVDAYVGNHIFNSVIGSQGLLREKTRVFVTHNISYLPQVDQIIVLKDNRITEIGTYNELISNNGNFSEFMRTYFTQTKNEGEYDDDAMASCVADVAISETDKEEHEGIFSPSILSTNTNNNSVVCDILTAHDISEYRKNSRTDDIIQEETMEVGRVHHKVFLLYLKSMGVAACVFIVYFCLTSQGFIVGMNFWLVHWTSQSNVTDSQRDFLLGVYGGLGTVHVILILAYALTLALATTSASRFIHRCLIQVIMHCPMSFFETTPLGRIINRLSKDISVIDEELQQNMDDVLRRIVEISAIIFVISYSTPIFLAGLFPIATIYYFVQRFFVASSRQLKRMEAVRLSPIFNHFLESIHGSATIRAYKYQETFIKENSRTVDYSQMAHFAWFSARRWLGVSLDFCGNMIIFLSALFCVVRRDSISAGEAGISLAYASNVVFLLQRLLERSSELEVNIVSVERTENYLVLPSEAAREKESSSLSPNVLSFDNPVESQWPSHGVVSFENYSTRYREGLDLVLHDITFTTKPSEKIGIVGRTGAGKSSVALALFRIIEPVSGRICIDGIDIMELGLKELRSKLSIIPQDPVLFSGTIRCNLDPFGTRSDLDVWTALEITHLRTFIEERKGGLAFEVEEGGSNLSVGQRQLVCLARALLRQSKVLVLDEATAAVDMETDALIQETIQAEFTDCTILTIAHRLNTVMEYDRILVLDQGQIAEFDTPQNLLSIKDGAFYGMMNKIDK